MTVPLFLLIFSRIYLSNSLTDPAVFTHPLDNTTALYFLSGAATRAAEPVEPAILSRTAIGFFGYPGEETGVPTTLVLIRVDDYHRVLMASSGAEGETVTQAARFSLADGAMSLSVREINDDEYMDVVVGNLVLYGSDGGLRVW